MVAVVGVPAQVSNAVGDGIRVAIGVESREHREGPSRLQCDDAAQREVAEETIAGRSRRKVRYESLTHVLVRIRTLPRPIVEVLRRADECGKRSVIERVRESVIRVQVKNL